MAGRAEESADQARICSNVASDPEFPHLFQSMFFGLPDRDSLNNTFIALVIGAGVTCLITDVAKSRSVTLAVDLLLGRDKRARRYVEAYRQRRTHN